MQINSIKQLCSCVDTAVKNVRITDVHTHLFSKCFGDLFLYGIDELLTYHYLISETFRHIDMPYDDFWKMSKREQADLVWKTLFVDNTPVSEACRSIITIFRSLGLETSNKDLDYYRHYFESLNLSEYIDRVFDIVGLDCLVMTNDPFDDNEKKVWDDGYMKDERFKAALRVDFLLNFPEKAFAKLMEWGYRVELDPSGSLSEETNEEIKRFFNEWIDKMDALYCAASLPPSFVMDDGSLRSRIIKNCIMPVCRSRNIPMGLMIGVKRQVNPYLRLAGDSVGKTDIKALEYLCSNYPDVKFLVTMLSLENQHELIVTTRKFRNIMLFGCWWFVNNPSIIESLTRMRIEMLGMSFIPQHSDCRVFEQLISKWQHSKVIISKVLVEKYKDLMDTGYVLSEEEVTRDVANLFGGTFWRFLGRKKC